MPVYTESLFTVKLVDPQPGIKHKNWDIIQIFQMSVCQQSLTWFHAKKVLLKVWEYSHFLFPITSKNI